MLGLRRMLPYSHQIRVCGGQSCSRNTPSSRVWKNRLHVDLRAEDRETEVARLERLGAKRLADHEMDGTRWTTLADVEGNEFCIV
jgi:hypothetical protein